MGIALDPIPDPSTRPGHCLHSLSASRNEPVSLGLEGCKVILDRTASSGNVVQVLGPRDRAGHGKATVALYAVKGQRFPDKVEKNQSYHISVETVDI